MTGWLKAIGLTKDSVKPGTAILVYGVLPRAQNNLNVQLAYEPNAITHLKAAHVMQVGNIILDKGEKVRFGLTPAR